MLDFEYTLNNRIYRYALKQSAESEASFSNAKFLITGGAATQLIIGEDYRFLRPTDDIDLFPDSYITTKKRKIWSKDLSEKIKKDGFPNNRSLEAYWAQVSFRGLRSDLFIRLNCLSSYYYLSLKNKIKGEFDRAIIENFEGVNIRYQHPMDIIINKTSRILELNKIAGIHVNAKVLRLLQILIKGGINDIDTKEYLEDLDFLASHRQLNIEDLGRLSPNQVQAKVQGYKIRKDVYDICNSIDASRKRGIDIDPSEFKKALGLMLSYSIDATK